MMKKTLLTLLLFVSIYGFAQEKTIENVSTAPNPFTEFTNITFDTNTKSEITLVIKNVLGKTVFKKRYKAEDGKNKIVFYKNNLSAGMYFYSIQNEERIISKRFVIK